CLTEIQKNNSILKGEEMSFWSFKVGPDNIEASGVESIQSTLKLLLNFFYFMLAISTLLYLHAIWPFFLKPDISNYAVHEFVFSDHYKAHTEALFERMAR